MWLVLLAVWMLLSGLDDLFIGLVFLLARRPRVQRPSKEQLAACPERSLAILVPLWHEDRVIARMLAHNLGAIGYSNYRIFAGVYRNDLATREALPANQRIHVVVCPHDGPTSKGDCLNQIYLGMQAYEAQHGVRFDIVITHDAEDLIHPESLPLINWFSAAIRHGADPGAASRRRNSASGPTGCIATNSRNTSPRTFRYARGSAVFCRGTGWAPESPEARSSGSSSGMAGSSSRGA